MSFIVRVTLFACKLISLPFTNLYFENTANVVYNVFHGTMILVTLYPIYVISTIGYNVICGKSDVISDIFFLQLDMTLIVEKKRYIIHILYVGGYEKINVPEEGHMFEILGNISMC